MQCFESHLPGARHRDAGAIEKTAPMTPAASESTPNAMPDPSRAPARIIVKAPSTSAPVSNKAPIPREVVIIASRLKEYVQARSEFNTSASVIDVLSDHVRLVCDQAIDNARTEGRKTVLDRDFAFLKSLRFDR